MLTEVLDKLKVDSKCDNLWQNVTKCAFISISARLKTVRYPIKPQVTIAFQYGTEFEYTNNEKDLGVQVVQSLKWNSQHEKLLNSANKRIGLLGRNCSVNRNVQQRKLLNLAIVRYQFEYCSQIWRPVHKTNLKKFEAMQKRDIKWVLLKISVVQLDCNITKK